MKLVIIYGSGASGKSHLAQKLAKSLSYNLCMKDEYKETQFRKGERSNVFLDWQKYESKSWQYVYENITLAQDNQNNLIIEGNFMRPQKKVFKKIIDPQTEVVEIYCKTKGFTGFRRFVARNKSGERHAVHRDHLWYWIVFLESLCYSVGIKPYRPFKLTKNYLEVDMTDFTKIDYEGIEKYIVDAT